MEVEAGRYGRPILRLGCDHATRDWGSGSSTSRARSVLHIEGQAEFAVENGAGLAWKEVNPGDMVNIPPDAIHGFRNGSDRDVKLLLTCEPGLGRFFEEAGTPLAENESGRANVSPEEIQRVLEVAERYGQRFPAPA